MAFGGDGEEDADKDVATARPSHRRLAEFTPSQRSWDQGHRIEVFLRIRPMLAKEEGLYGQGVVVSASGKGDVARFQNRIGTRMSVEDHQFDGVR